MLTLAACGGDTPAATTADGGIATTAPATDGTTAPDATGDTSLADAVTAVGTRYAFAATVTLDGAEVTRVEGVVFDGVGAYEVTTGDATVDYVTSDEGQWARQPGGDWTALSEAAPLVDPLEPLTRPLDLRVLETAGTDALLEVTYDGTALGFSDGGEVVVTVTITDGVVSSISYDVSVGDGTATVIITFDGNAEVAPIQVPPV